MNNHAWNVRADRLREWPVLLLSQRRFGNEIAADVRFSALLERFEIRADVVRRRVDRDDGRQPAAERLWHLRPRRHLLAHVARSPTHRLADGGDGAGDPDGLRPHLPRLGDRAEGVQYV